MKHSSNDTKRLLTVMLSIVAIGVIINSSMEIAFADTPSVAVSPNPLVRTIPGNKIIITGAADGTLPHFDVRVGFQEPADQDVSVSEAGANTPDGINGGGVCDLDTTDDPTDTGAYWVLTDGSTADATYGFEPLEFDFPDASPLPRVEIPLKSGTVTISYFNGATGPGSGEWTDQNNGGKSMSIDYITGVTTASKYIIHYCGYDDATTNNDHFSQEKEVQSQDPVAGEIIPINTTALLIAGINTNSSWIIVALSVIAGTSFAVLKFQVSRKQA